MYTNLGIHIYIYLSLSLYIYIYIYIHMYIPMYIQQSGPTAGARRGAAGLDGCASAQPRGLPELWGPFLSWGLRSPAISSLFLSRRFPIASFAPSPLCRACHCCLGLLLALPLHPFLYPFPALLYLSLSLCPSPLSPSCPSRVCWTPDPHLHERSRSLSRGSRYRSAT